MCPAPPPPPVKAWSLNHWTGRKVLRLSPVKEKDILALFSAIIFSCYWPAPVFVDFCQWFIPLCPGFKSGLLWLQSLSPIIKFYWLFSLQDVSYESFVFCSSSLCSASSFCSALVHLHPFTTTILLTFNESQWPEEKSILLGHIIHCKMKNQLQFQCFLLLCFKISSPSLLGPSCHGPGTQIPHSCIPPFILYSVLLPTWNPSPPLLLPRSLLMKLKSQFLGEILSHSSPVFSCFLFWTPICFISWTHLLYWTVGFPGGSEGKVSACKAVNLGSISGLGRSPGEGNGNLLRYSCLENPMDGEAW